MVPARNKAKCLSSVNHTTKTIHHSSCNKAREEQTIVLNKMKRKAGMFCKIKINLQLHAFLHQLNKEVPKAKRKVLNNLVCFSISHLE